MELCSGIFLCCLYCTDSGEIRYELRIKIKDISYIIDHQDFKWSCYYYRNFPICLESILLKWQIIFNQRLFPGSNPLFTSTNIIEIAEL